MPFYHILLALQESPTQEKCFFTDLTEQELKTKFLRPYRRGQRLFADTEIIPVSQIHSVKIVRTERTSGWERKEVQEKSWREMQEFNRRSNLLVLICPHGHSPDTLSGAREAIIAIMSL